MVLGSFYHASNTAPFNMGGSGARESGAPTECAAPNSGTINCLLNFTLRSSRITTTGM